MPRKETYTWHTGCRDCRSNGIGVALVKRCAPVPVECFRRPADAPPQSSARRWDEARWRAWHAGIPNAPPVPGEATCAAQAERMAKPVARETLDAATAA